MLTVGVRVGGRRRAYSRPIYLPPPPPDLAPTVRRRDPLRAIGVIVAVVTLVVCGAVTVAAHASTTRWYPPRWDARVAPIAAEVAKLRRLDFEHPVPVRFLAPAEFEREVGVDAAKVTDETRAETERLAAVLRSLGLLGGDVDLLKAIDTEQRSETLALYSFEKKEILVRGGADTLDVSHRVTIAHEMTHVLQDQHFDLTKLDRRATHSDSGSSDAFRALVEGDAVRTEDAYVKTLSESDRAEYEREQQAEAKRASGSSATVPDIVQRLFGAPYEFGPATAHALFATGGAGAVDHALTGPVPSTHIYLDPGKVDAPPVVPAPGVPRGTKSVGDPDTLGGFEIYLTLAMRLDPVRALDAAFVVTGGRAVTYRKGDVDCYRVALATTSRGDAGTLQHALQQWAASEASTTVDATSTPYVQFTACDPGKRAAAPAHERFDAAAGVLDAISGITVAATEGGTTLTLAHCISDRFVHDSRARPVLTALGGGSVTPAQTETLRRLLAADRDACAGAS